MEPEPVTPGPPRPARPALLRQEWRDVAFLHWAVDAAAAARLLPPGTRPDELDGRTYAGLVLLRIRLGFPVGPRLPWPGPFGQANVRLYSVDADGRRGVVFLSLCADRLLPALGGRALGLPYRWAGVRVDRDGDRLRYRVEGRSGHASVDLRIGRPTDAGPLERFLTARWGLHHRVAGRTVHVAVHHRPWTLHDADVLACETDLLAAAGLGGTGPPASALFSDGMDGVRIGPPA